MRLPLLLLALALGPTACPPPGPPAPVPPDADAAPSPPAPPTPVQDAGVSKTCLDACDRLSTLCGAQHADCGGVLQMVQDHGTIRTSCGKALCPSLTCGDIAKAQTVAAVQALGLRCP